MVGGQQIWFDVGVDGIVWMKEDGVIGFLWFCVCLFVLWCFLFIFRGECYLFIGIIEGVGCLVVCEFIGGDVCFIFNVGNLLFDNVQMGESIVINGVCFIVIVFDDCSFQVDVFIEILGLIMLGQLGEGVVINLECVMCLIDCFGGYLVSGYVDGFGQVLFIYDDVCVQCWCFVVLVLLCCYIVRKGLICVDGVSFIVNEVDDEGFEVVLILYIVVNIVFFVIGVGSVVNFEIDLVVCYVE